MEKIILTGAAGFIGSCLRKNLRKDYRLLCTDLAPPNEIHPEEVWYPGDITDPVFMDKLFQEIGDQCATVVGLIHLAWYYDFSNNPHPMYRAFTDGLSRLMENYSKACPRDGVFVFAQSMATMVATVPGQKQTESSPTVAAWQYPASKVEAGNILRKTPIRQVVCELVLAAVYSDSCEIVPLFQSIERIRRKSIEAWFFPGRTDRGLTYVHVEDCAAGFRQCIEQRQNLKQNGSGVERFLIGEQSPLTNQQIMDAATERFHMSALPKLIIPKLFALIGAIFLGFFRTNQFVKPWMVRFSEEHFEFDCQRALKLLSWQPQFSIQDSLFKIIDLAKENPNQWLEINQKRPWQPEEVLRQNTK